MSDRICVIQAGFIEQLGSPEDIYYRPQSKFIATFFGDNNLLPGIKTAAAEKAAWRIDTAIGPLLSDDIRLREMADNSRLTVAIRPEALQISLPEQALALAGDNRLGVEVKTADFIGPIRQLRGLHPR